MIYSRGLISEEPKRQEHPLGLRPHLDSTPHPTPKTVRIVKTVDTQFGSIYANVKLNAICTLTGEVVDSLMYRCNSWEVESSVKFVKRSEFAERLSSKGFKVEN